jgi:hypothetical protein
VQPVDVLDVPQPLVDQAEVLPGHRRLDAPAAVVAAHDDVLDLQDLDRVLHNRQHVEVGMDDEVRDVAVDEELARLDAGDFLRRDAAVGTADPQELRLLDTGRAREEITAQVHLVLDPGLVVQEQAFVAFHQRWLLHVVRVTSCLSKKWWYSRRMPR